MRNYGLPKPEFYEEKDSFKAIFRNSKTKLDQKVSEQVLRYRELTIKYCKTLKTAKEIMDYLNIKSRNYVSDNVMKSLIKL